MHIVRLLSCIVFSCFFIRLAVKSVNPLPLAENYMVLFCFALFTIALIYAIASDSITYKKRLPHSNRMATFFISGGFVIATLFVIIKKDALNQPTLFKVAHSGDTTKNYTIDFKTSGVYVSESNYFAQKFSDGIYHVEADTIILIDSLPGIERLLKISETKTGKHLLQINSKEGIPTGDSLQIIVDNRKK